MGSIEIARIVQIKPMNGEIDMFDEDTNMPIRGQTTATNEELAQLSYRFWVKTGTLTEN